MGMQKLLLKRKEKKELTKYLSYLHKSGTIRIRLFNLSSYADALESPFCVDVAIIYAESKDEAVSKAIKHFRDSNSK